MANCRLKAHSWNLSCPYVLASRYVRWKSWDRRIPVPPDSIILSILFRRSKNEKLLVHRFLTDPARAQSFFFSEDDYADLACKVMKYTVRR